MTDRELYVIAKEMTKRSYAPFSKFCVGAALECKDGTIFTGCNVENSSFGGTICAERVAMTKAISEGYHDFKQIMITSSGGEAWPCGICRQFMKEFCDDDFIIYTAADIDHIRKYTMDEILPEGFRMEAK
ncbi:MAG: cytidine deaminase [Clostridia bacterium]|nr:cytidine deaminase [Clostridia bacterium]